MGSPAAESKCAQGCSLPNPVTRATLRRTSTILLGAALAAACLGLAVLVVGTSGAVATARTFCLTTTAGAGFLTLAAYLGNVRRTVRAVRTAPSSVPPGTRRRRKRATPRRRPRRYTL